MSEDRNSSITCHEGVKGRESEPVTRTLCQLSQPCRSVSPDRAAAAGVVRGAGAHNLDIAQNRRADGGQRTNRLEEDHVVDDGDTTTERRRVASKSAGRATLARAEGRRREERRAICSAHLPSRKPNVAIGLSATDSKKTWNSPMSANGKSVTNAIGPV
eukprot:scaffold22423_cov120-Isochrysis_galbana.AAC.8